MTGQSIIKAFGHCSPIAYDNFKRNGTCISLKLLSSIADIINKTKGKPIIKVTNNLNDIKQQLDKFYGTTDILEWNVTDNKISKTIRDLYRPVMPGSWKSNPREWLSNLDIQNVMSQYSKKYSDFKFLGVFSVDFYTEKICSFYSICNFNLFDFLASGKTKLGLIANLDSYYGKGSHWVAISANFKPKSKQFGICYYDSGGSTPPEQLKLFISQIKNDASIFFRDRFDRINAKFNMHTNTGDGKQGNTFGEKFKVQANVKQHQRKNTECGIFSMLFLILCLERQNLSYNEICSILHVGSDDFVHAYRKHLFYDKYA